MSLKQIEKLEIRKPLDEWSDDLEDTEIKNITNFEIVDKINELIEVVSEQSKFINN